MTERKGRGGPREGAGRKPPEAVAARSVNVRLTDAHADKWKRLGGVAWLRRMIDEAKE
jgi:hypothetical protein